MFYALTAPQCDINLGSFVICVDTQEPIKTPKSLKSHKVKKLIYNKHIVIGKYPSRSTSPPELFWDHAKFSNCGLCKGQQEKHRRIKANKNNRCDLTSQRVTWIEICPGIKKVDSIKVFMRTQANHCHVLKEQQHRGGKASMATWAKLGPMFVICLQGEWKWPDTSWCLWHSKEKPQVRARDGWVALV